MRKALKAISSISLEPKYGQILHWVDKAGEHTMRWGHRERTNYRKREGNSRSVKDIRD